MRDTIIAKLQETIAVKKKILEDENLLYTIESVAGVIIGALSNEKKLVLCGNGGSASDALHFAGEIVGRFQMERNPWPAVVLNSDVATMTAIANDYSYDDVYARQAQAHLNEGDIFVGISTSGNSKNIIKAVDIAKNRGAITVGLLGKDGGKLRDLLDYPIVVPSNTTARIQESHICIIHILCELIELGMK